MSSIGFQGMSINSGKLVAPALQVPWWWNSGDGKGRFSDKVIKIPSRRARCLTFYLK
jgi:sulfite reductase (ferredoxin)